MKQERPSPPARGRIAAGLAALVTIALFVTACGGGDDASSTASNAGGGETNASEGGGAKGGEPVKIAFLIASEGAGYSKGMVEGMEAMLPEVNAEMDVFGADFDPGKQVAQCQDVLTQGTYDAIITLPAASPTMVSCAREAGRAEAPLIAVGAPVGNDLATIAPTVPGVTAQVLMPVLTQFGAGPDGGVGQLLPGMCAEVEGTCRIGFITGVPALALTAAAEKGVEEVVAGSGGKMELAGSCSGNYDRNGGLACMQELLQKSSEINAVFSQSDDMTLGAERALSAAGMEVGEDVVVGTHGGSFAGIENIRSGRWFGSILALAESEGQIALELAAKAARGEKVPPATDPNEAVGLPLVLDQGNLSEFPDFEGQWES